MSEILKPGQVVKIKVKGFQYSPDGWATAGRCRDQETNTPAILIFDEIDLYSYPSFSDFLGESVIVKEGETGTIIKYIGRPFKIQKDTAWFQYDIYEILIKNTVKQIFKQNICEIKK
jgi:hypothetical protein